MVTPIFIVLLCSKSKCQFTKCRYTANENIFYMMENNMAPCNIEKEEDMQIVPILRYCYKIFLLKWKWFALSVLVCLVLGFLYQQAQPRIFMRQSVMLIEDADVGSFPGSHKSRRGNMSNLLELNGISVGDNLKNEIFILTSYRLMERVVDSLGLNVDFTTKENLHRVAIYKHRPFEIKFPAEEPRYPVSFDVEIVDYNTFRVSHLLANKEEYEGEWLCKAGEVVNTPAGEMTFYPEKNIDKFPKDKVVRVTRMSKAAATAGYYKRISATEYDKESSLIVLSLSDMNVARAEDILNEVFNAYKRDVVDNKNRVAQSTLNFIDGRISLIGSELSSVESQLADFKQNNKIIDFKQTAQVFAAESSSARQQTLALETRLEVANYLLGFLHEHSHEKEVIPMLNLEGATFVQQIAEYNKLMMERNLFVSNSTAESAMIAERDRQLNALKKSIMASLNSYVKSVELQVKEARTNEELLNGQVGAAPAKEKEALAIERQQLLKANLYNYLLNKREEVAMQLAINEANVRIVENPMGSPNPVSPRRSLILLISFVLGIMIPAAVLWIRSLFDVTVSGRRDIENNTTIPLAGEIPAWEHADAEGNGSLISNSKADAPIVEAFRVLRYGLNFMRHNAKVFVTTSTTPGQGKSFISSNLAVILSMAKKRVLLVDADIRKRTLSGKYKKAEGLTSFLIDEENNITLDKLVISNAIAEGVDLLPAGMLPPNPSELLMSDRLEELIEQAKQQYDYVVIDTTPIFSVADAGIVARVADLLLYVVRVGVQEREFLPELEKMYQAKRFRNICIVLYDTKGY